MKNNGNLYIFCDNIVTSMYIQKKLVDVFGFRILSQTNNPHYTDRICLVPQPNDEERLFGGEIYYSFFHPNDPKGLICYCDPTYDRDGNEIYDKNKQWIDWAKCLTMLSFLYNKG